MNPLRDQLSRDISLWLAGETVGSAADRAIAGLATDASARSTAGAAVAIEDLVRDWYGGIPLPPPEPHLIARRERRSLVSAAISAVAAGVIAASLIAGGPFARALDAVGALNAAGPRLPVAASSWWQLRQLGPESFGR